MARMSSDRYALSLAGMMAALTLLFLYLAGILPTARLAMYAIASLFGFALCMEQHTLYAFLLYIGVSLLALLILPNIIMVLPYIFFFGHYNIGKFHIERIRDKILSFGLKLVYFNAGLILNYYLAKNVLLGVVPDFLKDNFWLFLGLAQVAFVAYDFIFSKMAEWYENRLRRFLIRRSDR